MGVIFHKYQGTGNDFILIDNRTGHFTPSGDQRQQVIARLCNRHFGIGADGLILLEDDQDADFKMLYFNADGREGSLCGNGSRCAAAFAHSTGIVKQPDMHFRAIDGEHAAEIISHEGNEYMIKVWLNDVRHPTRINANAYVVHTGSPHLVVFSDEINGTDVFSEGQTIRNSDRWAPEGINVNFVKIHDQKSLSVRTYERGVENETLSCGTGVTAAAIAAYTHQGKEKPGTEMKVRAPGGKLSVAFTPPEQNSGPFTGIHLTGPAVFVFKGEMIDYFCGLTKHQKDR